MFISRALKASLCGAAAAWLVAISAAVLGAQVKNADAAKMKNPVKATAESIDAGKTAYNKYCKFCHNDGGTGNGALAPKGHASTESDRREVGSRSHRRRDLHQHQGRHRPEVRHEADEGQDEGRRHLERRQLPAQPRSEKVAPAGCASAPGSSILALAAGASACTQAPTASDVFTPAHRTTAAAVRDFFLIRPAADAADSVSAQDARRKSDAEVHGDVPRVGREGPGRRHPKREDLHDLPRLDRDRSAADHENHERLLQERRRPAVAARLRLHA